MVFRFERSTDNKATECSTVQANKANRRIYSKENHLCDLHCSLVDLVPTNTDNMDGFGDNFDQNDVDPAAEFLAREKDQLAILGDDVIPPATDSSVFSSGEWKRCTYLHYAHTIDFDVIITFCMLRSMLSSYSK